MSDQRPTYLIGDQHASLETSMPHWRPACLIEEQYASLETHRPCLIKHVGVPWVYNQAFRLQLGLLVWNGSSIRHVGLQWVSGRWVYDRSPIYSIHSFVFNTILCLQYNSFSSIQSFVFNTILYIQYNPLYSIQLFVFNSIIYIGCNALYHYNHF